MRIALAQIDCRLGDIEGICERIESQAVLARGRGADLLCTPSPLFSGLYPGGLLSSANFEHDLVRALEGLSSRLAVLGVTALVPAVVGFDGAPLFEAFMLKEGRVVPLRRLLAQRRGDSSDDMWAPPVFDVRGTRIAVTFDVLRDIDGLPAGCDLLIFFQSNAFDATNEISAAAASIADGHFTGEVARKGVWLACMSPVGAFDDMVFSGGSFVMDDSGRTLAAAPSFEECLLVQDIRRGVVNPALEAHELPQYNREEWLWESLRLYVRDTVSARGHASAVLLLSGDLPSSLACALAVDALGPRNVVGVFVERGSMVTPAEERAEASRASTVRELARNLGIRLEERSAPDVSRIVDGDRPAAPSPRLAAHAEGLCLEEAALRLDALPVSSITKTHVALAAPDLAGGFLGAVAPFGDVYLTELEFIARARRASTPSVPAALATLGEVRGCMLRILRGALFSFSHGNPVDERVARALEELEPHQVDSVLEAYVDRAASFEDIPLSSSQPEACALLCLLVGTGEPARRLLPGSAIVSGRAFIERSWPESLAWSDMGRRGEDPVTFKGLADAELARLARQGAERGARMREEVIGIIARSFGIPPEVLEGLDLDGGRASGEDAGTDGPDDPGADDGEAPDAPQPAPPAPSGAAPVDPRLMGPFFSQN